MKRFTVSKHLSWVCAACLAGMAIADSASASLSFTFNFTDPAGIGFNAAGATGADRRAALANAAGRIGSYFMNYNATINLDVNGSVTNDSTLASAGTNWNAANPGYGFNDRGDVMLKVLGGNGADPAPGVADGIVNWNFEDHNWALGDTIGVGQYDFISTAMHEFTHALGFAGSIDQDGYSSWSQAPGTSATWGPMDQWLADSSGSLINQSTFALDGARWATASVGGSSLFFDGPNAVAAYGGPVPLWSPTTWEPGSSGGSHLDDDTFVDPDNKLMNAMSAPPGMLDIRDFSPIEIGILADIGYTQIVPEPTSLLLLALGTLVLGLRRRAA